MKIRFIALMAAVFLAGCASSRQAVVPALDGTPRVPVNREIPATVPLTAPNDNNTAAGG